MKKIFGLIAALILSVMWACEGPTSSSDKDEKIVITGNVLDVQGNPVKGVIIRLSYIPSNEVQQPQIFYPNNLITYSIESKDKVKLLISNHVSGDTTRVLVDDIQNGGSYAISWDGRNQSGKIIPESIYDNHLENSQDRIVRSFLFAVDYESGVSSMENYEYISKTDNAGIFQVTRDDIIFLNNKDLPLHLSSRVNVWALHDDYGITVSDTLKIESPGANSITLHFK